MCCGGIVQLKIANSNVNETLISLKIILPDSLICCAPTLLGIARMTGTSARSLQRKLLIAGMTYSKLLELARYEIASALLINSDMKLIEVAFAADYTDTAHFSRAFRRMSGMTPAASEANDAAAKKAQPLSRSRANRPRALTIGTETETDGSRILRRRFPGGDLAGGTTVAADGADKDRSKASPSKSTLVPWLFARQKKGPAPPKRDRGPSMSADDPQPTLDHSIYVRRLSLRLVAVLSVRHLAPPNTRAFDVAFHKQLTIPTLLHGCGADIHDRRLVFADFGCLVHWRRDALVPNCCRCALAKVQPLSFRFRPVADAQK